MKFYVGHRAIVDVRPGELLEVAAYRVGYQRGKQAAYRKMKKNQAKIKLLVKR